MSRQRVLDTNRLIIGWRRGRILPIAEHTREDAANWARAMIRIEGTAATLTPVVIEFLCGTMNPHELALARAFLDELEVVDEGRILAEDWEKAKGFAAWVPRDPRARDFADCLIHAIAKRLRRDVLTSDSDFQRRSRTDA